MPVRTLLAAAALALVVGGSAVDAQPLRLGSDVTLELSGGIQPRLSLGIEGADDTERLGFGLRRARFQFRVALGDRFGLEYDLDATPGDVRSVDLFAFADLGDRVQLRAGRLPPAQLRAFAPTSYTRIDAVDRAAIAERWADGTIGASGRDIGLDVTARAGRTELALTVHNGTGGFGREVDNFRESSSDPSVTRGTDRLALAFSGSAHHQAGSGVSFGGFASGSARGNERTALGEAERGYATAGGHLYWGERPGSQPVRVKLDAVGTAYESVGDVRQRSAGVSLLGAARVLVHGEAFARAEHYWADVDVEGTTYGTAGLSYSPSAALGRDYRDGRLTLAYTVRRDPSGDLGHLAVLQGQIVF